MVGSPAWWLTQPHQFLVDDDAQQPVGVVDDVEAQPDTGAPHELVVVQGWGRRRVVIPIDAVAEIMPAERRLIVRRSTQQRWRRLDRRR
ncbi:MAG TPA: PRC-barrel domain-containing protein, partial [Actinomycetes bacterium]|nr:PRC-barrel domain-containing protein [Actinomycetes bacterium]